MSPVPRSAIPQKVQYTFITSKRAEGPRNLCRGSESLGERIARDPLAAPWHWFIVIIGDKNASIESLFFHST